MKKKREDERDNEEREREDERDNGERDETR